MRKIYYILIILFFSVGTKAQDKITASHDSICPGQCVTLTDSAASNARYMWSDGHTTSTITVCPVVTTTYTDFVTDSPSHHIDTIRIVVIPLPVPVISGTSRVCRGRRDTLYASGGTTYRWCDGSTHDTYFTGNIDADSVICLTAYNILGCSVTDTFRIDTISCLTGVSEINSRMSYEIYPNPGNGIFNFVIASPPGRTWQSQSTIEVYNELGQQVYFLPHPIPSPNGEGAGVRVDLSTQPNGVYFYRITATDGSLMGEGKLLIER